MINIAQLWFAKWRLMALGWRDFMHQVGVRNGRPLIGARRSRERALGI
jgi:hypothetical protein